MGDYPPGMTLRPLDTWPGTPTQDRRPAAFASSWRATMEVLDRELKALGPYGLRSVNNTYYYPKSILQIALREQDFRIDGMPKANAAPSHPGVVLSIEPKGKPPLSFPCDTFTRWQDNLRGIALGLEALRKVERYGITQTGQQYRGWQAIEAKGSLTAEAAESFLRQFAGSVVDETPTMANVHRRAKAKAHPDRNDGDQTVWDQVAQAAAVLGLS